MDRLSGMPEHRADRTVASRERSLERRSLVRTLDMQGDFAGEPRLTLPLARIIAAGEIALHIEGADKRSALEAALTTGDRPISAVFRHAGKPVHIYWAP